MDWKSNLFNQLKTCKYQYNIYDTIISNCETKITSALFFHLFSSS